MPFSLKKWLGVGRGKSKRRNAEALCLGNSALMPDASDFLGNEHSALSDKGDNPPDSLKVLLQGFRAEAENGHGHCNTVVSGTSLKAFFAYAGIPRVKFFVDKCDGEFTKEHVVAEISNVFKTSSSRIVVLYYCGFADARGNWTLGTKGGATNGNSAAHVFTFDDLCKLWILHRKHSQHLVLLLDCPHSGQWVRVLESLSKTEQMELTMCVQASSTGNSTMKANRTVHPPGVFTHAYMDACSEREAQRWPAGMYPSFYSTRHATSLADNGVRLHFFSAAPPETEEWHEAEESYPSAPPDGVREAWADACTSWSEDATDPRTLSHTSGHMDHEPPGQGAEMFSSPVKRDPRSSAFMSMARLDPTALPQGVTYATLGLAWRAVPVPPIALVDEEDRIGELMPQISAASDTAQGHWRQGVDSSENLALAAHHCWHSYTLPDEKRFAKELTMALCRAKDLHHRRTRRCKVDGGEALESLLDDDPPGPLDELDSSDSSHDASLILSTSGTPTPTVCRQTFSGAFTGAGNQQLRPSFVAGPRTIVSCDAPSVKGGAANPPRGALEQLLANRTLVPGFGKHRLSVGAVGVEDEVPMPRSASWTDLSLPADPAPELPFQEPSAMVRKLTQSSSGNGRGSRTSRTSAPIGWSPTAAALLRLQRGPGNASLLSLNEVDGKDADQVSVASSWSPTVRGRPGRIEMCGSETSSFLFADDSERYAMIKRLREVMTPSDMSRQASELTENGWGIPYGGLDDLCEEGIGAMGHAPLLV